MKNSAIYFMPDYNGHEMFFLNTKEQIVERRKFSRSVIQDVVDVVSVSKYQPTPNHPRKSRVAIDVNGGQWRVFSDNSALKV